MKENNNKEMARTQPNIVFIMSDQHSHNVLGCYGNTDVSTPNIDALAENGIQFDNAYCNNPVCVPSRMSMLTGLYSHKINVFNNADPLPPHLATWPLLLRTAGYETVISGRSHLLWGDKLAGFGSRLCGDRSSAIPWVKNDKTMIGGSAPQGIDKHMGADDNAPHANHDIEANRHAKKYLETCDKTKPFALFIGYYQPHAPFLALKKHVEKYRNTEIAIDLNEPCHPFYLPFQKAMRQNREINKDELQTLARTYYAMTSHVDELVGDIQACLKKQNLLDNTIVIYASDHGEMLGRHGLWHKMNFYENSVRIPLIISCPEKFGFGRKTDRNVSLLDLFPTFLELAGSRDNIELDGSSLVPLLEGETKQWNNRVIAETIGVTRGRPGRMLKRDHFKLLMYHQSEPILFDLSTDPMEQLDLAKDEKYSQILTGMIKEASIEWDPEKVNKSVDANLKHIYYHHIASRLPV